MARRIALLLAVLISTVGLVPSSQATTGETGKTVEPARRSSPDPKEKKGEEGDEQKKPEAVPCPQELWTVPLEVEGIACVLLVPKEEEKKKEDADAKDDPAKDANENGESSDSDEG